MTNLVFKTVFACALFIATKSAIAQTNYASSFMGIDFNDSFAQIYLGSKLTNTSQMQFNYNYQETGGNLYDFSLMATNTSGIHDLALGASFLYFDSEIMSDSQAVAALLEYRMHIDKYTAISFSGKYAPSVLAGNGLEEYISFDSKFEIKLMPNANIHLGYKYINFEYDNNASVEFEKGFIAGFKFLF